MAVHEAYTSYWNFGDLEGLHERTSIMVVDVDRAVVETGEDPGLGGMEVYAFYAVRTSEEFPLDRV